MRQFTVNHNDCDQRVDKYILKVCKNLPKSMMYRYIRTKHIKVNGKRCEVSQRLQLGDTVTMYINDEFFANEGTPKLDLRGISTSLSVVYEDANVLIVDKPVGLVVHADNDHTTDTLVDRVKKYLIGTGEYRPDEELSFAPALCNRLDRNTCGLVVCAKNAKTLRDVNQMVKDNLVHKKYLCVCTAKPPKLQDTIVAYHHKDGDTNSVRVVDTPKPNYKQIVTEYRVVDSKGGLYLLEVGLVTGRTHQIRAHLSHIGCPLLGDAKYGNADTNRRYHEPYQLLCAYSLEFTPTEGSSLGYLSGKVFKSKEVQFLKRYGFR